MKDFFIQFKDTKLFGSENKLVFKQEMTKNDVFLKSSADIITGKYER